MELEESLLEESNRKRAQSRKRVKILGALMIVAIIARIYTKNPPPPPKAIHNQNTVKALPGMLARLPASQRDNISHEVLVQLQEADAIKIMLAQKTSETFAKGTYKAYAPASAPVINPLDLESQKKEKFSYMERAASIALPEETNQVNGKNTIIRLTNGRFIKARRAETKGRECLIEVDKSLYARLPSPLIRTVLNDAPNWKEPLPKGYIELNPAKGITIQVAKTTANRISALRDKDEENNPS